MCRTHQHIENSSSWYWDGSRIEHETTIPHSRQISGLKNWYDVDIRDFILDSDNRIIRKALERISDGLPQVHREKFLARKEGCFDFRVDVLKEFITQRIRYEDTQQRNDIWRRPDETLELKYGDCEDRAFLLASLMIASGLSKYVVRVSFGKISDTDGKSYDHVWVMYKNENGIWQLIEPLSYCANFNKKNPNKTLSYTPSFVMNNDHLWSVDLDYNGKPFSKYIKSRKFWKNFTPQFGYKIHKELVGLAIDPVDFKKFLMSHRELCDEIITLGDVRITSADLCLQQFAYMVSNVDLSLKYDPRLHFDNAFIRESFDLFDKNFRAKTLKGLARALHALGDFYAHSSYGVFAKVIESKSFPVFEEHDTTKPDYSDQFRTLPHYGGLDFDLTKFSTNTHLYRKKDYKAEAIKYWKDQIISGRFGQRRDSQTLLERTQFWPGQLKEEPNQGALPHHNEMAVDSEVFDTKKHKLFTDGNQYKKQFEMRKATAIKHISMKYGEWKKLF